MGTHVEARVGCWLSFSPLSFLETRYVIELELGWGLSDSPVSVSDREGLGVHKPGHALGFYMGAGIPIQVFRHVQQVFLPTKPSIQFYDKHLLRSPHVLGIRSVRMAKM